MVVSRAAAFSLVAFQLFVSPFVRGDDASSLDSLTVTHVGLHGPTDMRVDLVILGDGYVAEDYRRGGTWDVDTARLIKNFFEKPPFKTHRLLFNVHLVQVVSQDRGADSSPDQDEKRTALDATYGCHNIERLLACQDEAAVLRAARNAQAVDIILVLVNDRRFGGSGGCIEGIPAPCCSTESTAYLTAIHELGHSYADLADEYVDEDIRDQYPLPASGDIEAANVTLKDLVDTSSRARLIETLKWGHFLEEPNAARRYGQGYFEGGYYRANGVYRPAQSCVMANEYGGGTFCFVCNAEVTSAIFRTAGRGPGGGVFPTELALMRGRMRRPHYLYSMGLFGNLESVLKKIEKTDSASAKELEQMQRLREGIESSLTENLKKLEKSIENGEALAVHEQLGLLSVSFKATRWIEEIETRGSSIRRDPSFKKELKAAKELQKLVAVLRNRKLSTGQRRSMKRMLEKFVKKHTDTKSAGTARSLADDL